MAEPLFDAILPEPLIESPSVKCFAFEQSTRKQKKDSLCLFKALALQLQTSGRLEEKTCKIFGVIMETSSGTDTGNIQIDFREENSVLENILPVKIFLYENDIVDNEVIAEFA